MKSSTTWLVAATIGCLTGVSVVAQETNRLLLTNATIISLVEGEAEPFDGYIVVDGDGRISSIGRDDPPSDIEATLVFDADGQVAMPGFVSGHNHLRGSVSRGIASDQYVTPWVERSQWHLQSDRLDAGDLYHYSLHGALDMLRGGVTTVYNYTNGVSGVPAEVYFEQLEAEFAAGGHFVFGYAPARDSGRSQKAVFDEVRWYLNHVAKHPRSSLLLRSSIASVAATSESKAEAAVEFAVLKAFPEFGKRMQLHYSSMPIREQQTPSFDRFQEHGVLGPNLAFAHFVHPSERMLRESAAASVAMIWCPLSNGRLGNGMADVPRYLEMGMTVGMGLDGQGSADIADPFENMRMGLYGLRFRDADPRGLQPLDMLRLHTIGTAKAIGVDDLVGTLEVGKLGDIILVDPRWPDTGPIVDLYATLVLAADRMNVSNVFVAGDHVMRHGKHASIDMKEVTDEVLRRVASKSPAMLTSAGHPTAQRSAN
jgi:cytosine/adenosine deaminase-related metal-dependent hydrolase